MQNPHDRLFRSIFSKPEHVAPELRIVLPERISSSIDWSALQLVPGSFVDEALSELRSDVLFSTTLSNREALLYCLLEHQSTPDPMMPHRLLRYMMRIWDQYLQTTLDARSLPAILPVVVYHGRTRWNAPTRFTELVALDEPLLDSVRRHIPSFEFFLDDLSEAKMSSSEAEP